MRSTQRNMGSNAVINYSLDKRKAEDYQKESESVYLREEKGSATKTTHTTSQTARSDL